jgi:hypothetical protein
MGFRVGLGLLGTTRSGKAILLSKRFSSDRPTATPGQSHQPARSPAFLKMPGFFAVDIRSLTLSLLMGFFPGKGVNQITENS